MKNTRFGGLVDVCDFLQSDTLPPLETRFPSLNQTMNGMNWTGAYSTPSPPQPHLSTEESVTEDRLLTQKTPELKPTLINGVEYVYNPVTGGYDPFAEL